jgi:hypothetical protein
LVLDFKETIEQLIPGSKEIIHHLKIIKEVIDFSLKEEVEVRNILGREILFFVLNPIGLL